jgi:hypothetical protein
MDRFFDHAAMLLSGPKKHYWNVELQLAEPDLSPD